MTPFFNDLTNWPQIYAKWLPELDLISGKKQRCPHCNVKQCFELFNDWKRAGSGICISCGFGEGVDWLKRVYRVSMSTVEQILRGEIDSVAELIPLRLPIHKQAYNPNEWLVSRRLLTATPLDFSIDNVATRYLVGKDINCLSVIQDVYFEPEVMLPLQGKKPKKGSVILCVLRDVNNNRVSVESIYLTSDGQHIDVPECSFKARGNTAFKGAALRLSPLQPTVLVTVSIKSALALQARFPDQAVIATLTMDGLKELQLPSIVCNVRIAVSLVDSNADVANVLAKRLDKESRQVEIHHSIKSLLTAANSTLFAEAY